MSAKMDAMEQTERSNPFGMLSEKDLSNNIVNLARMLGYVIHRDPTWRATGADAGWPDITMARNGRIIFAELKSKHGKLTADQEAVRDQLDGLHTEYYVWRPADWYAGDVERVLQEPNR